ncbi:hypothetical protein NLI96_g7492 [Meripilus lineatus]|uniref:Uncharacterized protein n=1 Tax=Meripilus lineatus TaxID=2056292 RepID=A0AAD5YCW7_9APHY|nr:hypothetical protein NLI96_g7492 [Physisporinus lineatus]
MKVQTLERRRTLLTDGSLESPLKLKNVISSRPFTQQGHERCAVSQLEVVLPSDEGVDAQLLGLSSKYFRCQKTLSEFLEFAKPFVDPCTGDCPFTAIGQSSHNPNDVWCLDQRGFVTIAAEKQTYQRLGLVGVRLPWKACEDTYIIRISLASNRETGTHIHPYNQKEKSRIENWDHEFKSWNIVYICSSSDFQPSDQNANGATEVIRVLPSSRNSCDVHIPTAPLKARPPPARSSDDHAITDWEDDVSALLEWGGLACLGSQRLRASDRVDSYVSLYEPPCTSQVGNLTHIKWSGLLAAEFIQRVLEVVSNSRFAMVIGHGTPNSPVSFLPTSSPAAPGYHRAPRPESEDTMVVIINSSTTDTNERGGRWLLAETIGEWDARWG